jgi:uncharacterized protein
MVLGILTLELDIAHAQSLKDKRAVLNKVKDRVRNSFNVSIAEIEANEVWNLAILGVAVVSNEQKHANQVLSQVVNLVETIHDCSLADYSTEFLRTD